MKNIKNMKKNKLFLLLMLSMAGFSHADDFSDNDIGIDLKEFATTTTPKSSLANPNWMSSDISSAWSQGYKGQNTSIIVVDDMLSNNKFSGNLNGTKKIQNHGTWTTQEASMIATSAKITSIDFNSNKAITLNKGLNVINASYGLMANTGYNVNQINFGALHNSVINSAKNGTALLVKAAGNSGVALNSSYNGKSDYMNLSLRGAQSVIFAGALNKNGTTTNKATIASYSNTAGKDATYQKNFLVVGVDGASTGLYGTSFAAPIITGYASILGSKFTKATPTQITNQLLNTARTDTIANYNVATYGRGEASLSRALAPISIK